MTSTARTLTGLVFEGHSAVIMAIVPDLDGDPITQAQVASITYKIKDLETETAVTDHDDEPLTITDVIFDDLQTPAAWTLDDTGFNFRHVIDGTGFPTGQQSYLYTCTITLGNGHTAAVQFLLECEATA